MDKVRRISGRFLLGLDADIDVSEVKRRLGNVVGIAYFAEAWAVDWEIDLLCRSVWQLLESVSFASFRIDTRRSDKRFPMNSMEVNQEVGAYVKDRSGARVDLGRPNSGAASNWSKAMPSFSSTESKVPEGCRPTRAARSSSSFREESIPPSPRGR